MLLKIDIMLQDDLVDTPKIINNKVFSNQPSNSETIMISTHFVLLRI